MGNALNFPVSTHSDVLIGDNVFFWGGHKPGIPLVHDSPQKRQFTSSVDVFNIVNSSFVKRSTTGTPPNGTIDYSTCCIGEDIYYFGGCCKLVECYHNHLFVLNTELYEWKEIEYDDGPMEKDSCGMVPFSINGKHYLLVIGGYGPVPTHDTPNHYKYTSHPNNPSFCYTNEAHVMCVSSTPGKWVVPMITGSAFPPLAGFSINTLAGNRAIIFGGTSVVNKKIVCTNDTFILTYSAINNSLNIRKLVKLSYSNVQWPVEVYHHSSVIITSLSSNGKRKHHLLVMGGKNGKSDVIPDTWILNIHNSIWNKVALPEIVSRRYSNSMTCFKMSVNCVWLLITGGLDSGYNSVATTNIVELVVGSPYDDNWRVFKIMNDRDISNKAQYTKLVSDHLRVREKEYQLMVDSTESPRLTEREDGAGLEENIEFLKQQLKQKDEETIVMLHAKDQAILEIIQQNKNTVEELIRENNELLHLQQKQQEVPFSLQSQLESRPWILQDEEVHITNTIIGEGSYGEVRVAVFRGARVAAKLLHELIVSRHNKDIFTREMEISSGIHHPNIVQFIGATRINNPILLYELMATSLYKRLQDNESLTHSQIVSIASDICTAMCYLHQWRPQPIIHRDISSPNVLMEPLPNDKWRAKLSDFGSANLQLHIKTIMAGNPAYAAPEASIPAHHSPAMDVYSFGILLIEMILHCAPEIDSTKREQRAHSIGWVEMREIVLKCIDNDRSQRISSEQLLTKLQHINML